MQPSPVSSQLSASDLELAGQRAYAAFVESLNEFLPPIVQAWAEMHPRVREAWTKAAAAGAANLSP